MNNLFTEHVFTNFLKRFNTVRGINSKRIPLISSYILIPNSSKIRGSSFCRASRVARVYERASVSEEIVEANRHRQNIRCSPQLQLRERVCCACLPVCLPACLPACLLCLPACLRGPWTKNHARCAANSSRIFNLARAGKKRKPSVYKKHARCNGLLDIVLYRPL